MRVWLMQIGEPLPTVPGARKMRTALLADEFRKRDWHVTWFASAFDHQQKKWIGESEEVQVTDTGVEIFLLKGCGYQKNISFKRFYDHRLVANHFEEVAPRLEKPDLIISSMPTYDLTLKAVEFGKMHNIPTFIDIRDQWPDVFFDYFPKISHPVLKIGLHNEYKMLNSQMRDATGLISMMGPILDWGLDLAKREKRSSDDVFFLGCPEHRRPSSEPRPELREIKARAAGKKVVTFIGTFGHYYNPKIIAEVSRQFSEEEVHFVIAGDGIFFNEVKATVGNASHVDLPGWLSSEDMLHVLDFSDIAIVPATKDIPAFPNKAFVYLSAGIPIISSCKGDLVDLLATYKAGLSYEPGSKEGLASALRVLLNNPELLHEFRAGAKKLFKQKLDSEKIYEKYVDHVLTMAQ